MSRVARRTVNKSATTAAAVVPFLWTTCRLRGFPRARGRRRAERTLLSAALVAGLLVGATPPALGSGVSDVVRPDDRRLAFEGHWGRTAEAAVTVDSGSRLRFRFTGNTVHALFDVSSVTVPAQIHLSVDGGPNQRYAVDRSSIPITAKGRGPHTVELSVKDVFSRVDRWTPPLETGVVLTGIRGRLLGQTPAEVQQLAFHGDSVTQGVMALCDVNTSDCADGTAAYPTLVADALRASLTQVGFGRQGASGCGRFIDAADGSSYSRIGKLFRSGFSHRPSTPAYGRVGHIRR